MIAVAHNRKKINWNYFSPFLKNTIYFCTVNTILLYIIDVALEITQAAPRKKAHLSVVLELEELE